MTWKEFLKPDWRKIITFIIIVFIFYFSISYALGSIFGIFYLPILAPAVLMSILFCAGDVCGGSILETSVTIFVGAVYSYLISCIIVWAWNRFRGENK